MVALALLASLVWPSWTLAFDGYGSSRVVYDRTLGSAVELAPRPSRAADETHAALALSSSTYGDLDFSVRTRTLSQLRTNAQPNPWETAWVLWDYADTTHFYYVVLKPNGWEIGKADPAYPGAQRFLATGSDRRFAADGSVHGVRVVQRGARMSVYADGAKLADVTDTQAPYARGALGIYCEDSRVRFSEPVVR